MSIFHMVSLFHTTAPYVDDRLNTSTCRCRRCHPYQTYLFLLKYHLHTIKTTFHSFFHVDICLPLLFVHFYTIAPIDHHAFLIETDQAANNLLIRQIQLQSRCMVYFSQFYKIDHHALQALQFLLGLSQSRSQT